MVVALLARHLKPRKASTTVVVGLLRVDRTAVLSFGGGTNGVRRCEAAVVSAARRPSYCTDAGGRKTVVPFVLADIGEGIREVTVKEWHVNVGDRVVEFDDVCEVESDKATVTITSRYNGSVRKLHYGVGDLAKVGDPLVDIELDTADDEGTAAAAVAKTVTAEPAVSAAVDDHDAGNKRQTRPPPPAAGAVPPAIAPQNFDKVLTTPAVRRIAAEKGIDLSTVRGSGKDGRVLKEDVLDGATAGSAVVPITGYRKSMRNAMEVSNAVPLLVITDEVDLTGLMQVKAQLAPHAKFTLLPFLIKATSLALVDHPYMNCTPTADFTKLRMNAAHNIGVAIDTPLGLAVPNIKGVQSLTVAEIAATLKDLRARAAAGKLSPADVTGGTFTVSNMGALTGTSFKPMIMPPEVALVALGQVKYRPRYNGRDELVKTPVMGVSWAADHRVLDGATVGKFFNDWRVYVENPALILANTRLSKN